MSDLIERLREDARIMAATPGFPTIAAELDEAADHLEADAARIAALEAEIARLNGRG